MRRIAFISSGMLTPKKANTRIARAHRYLNFGALSLATRLHEDGWEVLLRHGAFADPREFCRELVESSELTTTTPIFLSVPTTFAASWAQSFCSEAQAQLPGVRITCGGRWALDSDPQWLMSKLPNVEQFVTGTAEDCVSPLARMAAGPAPLERLTRCSRATGIEHLPVLNYGLLADSAEYHPSVEVSRGCGMGCRFCVERDVALEPIRSPSSIAESISSARVKLGSNELRFYFEASLFRPTPQWADELREKLNARVGLVEWRAETRVDSVSSRTLEHLAESGLRVFDLGLESASTRQLRAMGKSTRPEVYLRRASDLLRACRDNGVWAKVNVLLYAGETLASIAETLDWLEQHRDCIKGISANPVRAYGPGRYAESFVRECEALGASVVDHASLAEAGYADFHLSPEVDAEGAIEEGLRISRAFMTEQDYFDLKTFCYLDRTLGAEAFHSMAVEEDPRDLPFRVGSSAPQSSARR